MQHFDPVELLFIDIETATCQPSYNQLDSSWQQLWQEKSSKIIDASVTPADFYTQRAGVMAEFSGIICISIGFLSNPPLCQMKLQSFYGHDEKALLTSFITALELLERRLPAWCFAGHNIKEFDIPFICRRLLVNGMSLPACLDFQNRKPWEIQMVDTFQFWRFGDYKNFTSLNLLAAVLGVPSPKNDINGSMVGELYWQGDVVQREINLKRIVTYCEADVVATANVLLRMKNLEMIRPENIL